ncbi:hypothetical protein [Wolbachia endosymbiont of Mansonella perstans]|uniref:hypothetical protein n=1 Tax=Wolbachia endosymbiont of Mansonella perstans TaxID=229526 RepID=UPI001CE072DA|nr:hypothetical protein [Wolbachia endosymbiont of Mansonella perstans]MCA4774542.1 hypothetical protein [Wolbachia endosymbiont of Mansonella perstans]
MVTVDYSFQIDGTELGHESTPCYDKFLNEAFQELISYLLGRLELILFTIR